MRSATQNWTRPIHYMKCDLANFFVSIDKRPLSAQLRARIPEGWWQDLALQILWHDPRVDCEVRCPPWLFGRVPRHKRLAEQPPHRGLPIGNLSSQFFANIYLDALDQFVKHKLRARHYIRYVDDFVLLHKSPQQLNAWRVEIEGLLSTLNARLNPSKTIIQPVDRGVDFVGHVIKPWRTTARRRIVGEAVRRIEDAPEEDLMTVANSYLGLLRQSSHSRRDRARVARAILRRGRPVNAALTKTYQSRR